MFNYDQLLGTYRYSIVNNNDQEDGKYFILDETTRVLNFIHLPDFEFPADEAAHSFLCSHRPIGRGSLWGDGC